MSDKRGFLVGLLIGGVLGAAFAILYAPRTGGETRSRLRERGDELRGRVKGKTDDVLSRAREKAEEAVQQGRTVFEERTSRLRDTLRRTGKADRHDPLREALEDLEKKS